MNDTYLYAVNLVLAVSVGLNITLFALWRGAARDRQHYFDRWAGALMQLSHWRTYGLLRDPKTGRYTKKEPLQ